MRKRILQGCGVILCAATLAQAEPCEVTSSSGSPGESGSLPQLVAAVANDGACAIGADVVRATYGEALGMAQTVHLIHWKTSMMIQLTERLPMLQARGNEPLILQVDPDAVVRVQGAVPIALEGNGRVILDGMTLEQFPGAALIVASDDNLLHRVHVRQNGVTSLLPKDAAVQIFGSRNRLDEVQITANRGVGLWIDDQSASRSCAAAVSQLPASGNHLNAVTIADNHGAGLWMHGYKTHVTNSRFRNNGADGILLDNPAAEFSGCAPGTLVNPVARLHTAQIEQSLFAGNHGEGISAPLHALPAPVDLIAVAPLSATDLVVIGNVGRVDDTTSLWTQVPLDVGQLRVDVYLSDAADSREGMIYLATATSIDPVTRQFILHLPYPIVAEGHPVAKPVLTAVTVDPEHVASSPFARGLDLLQTIDWDRDGVPNAEEDRNHDGVVDATETDPRLPDSDGDLVPDGEELQRNLQPRAEDTDGDCVPDGVELGLAQTAVPAWNPVVGSMLARPRLQVSVACQAKLAAHKVTTLANAVPWNPLKPATIENLSLLFDLDPATTTDPGNPDTDRDGMTDGAEDWNWDGTRTAVPSADAAQVQTTLLGQTIQWQETDPRAPDSDGDGLLDGEEGDRDGDGTLGETETDPLQADTDRDGLEDAEEVRKYGTSPNGCDTEQDGLADGLEAGVVNPDPPDPQCRGLQTAGSNFASIGQLNPLRTDSDGDGLPDGAEDANANGWLDPSETDPTTGDTDQDGITDDIEMRGDLDRDGIPDWRLADVNNGAHCAPPEQMHDLDCDGMPNARDDDSDNDGCLDRDEGIDAGSDPHGIPAAYQAAVKKCGRPNGGGSSGGGGVPSIGAIPTAPVPPAIDPTSEYFSNQIRGGGSCSLVK